MITTQKVVELPGVITLTGNDRKSLPFDFSIEGFIYALNVYYISGSDKIFQELSAHPEIDMGMTLRIDNLETDLFKMSGAMLTYITANHSHYLPMYDETTGSLDKYLLTPLPQYNRMYKLSSPIKLKKGDVLVTTLNAANTSTLAFRAHLILIGKRTEVPERKIVYLRDKLVPAGVETPLDTKGDCEINRMIFEVVHSSVGTGYADIDITASTPVTYEYAIQGISIDIIHTRELSTSLIKEAGAGLLYRYSSLMYDTSDLVTGFHSIISATWSSDVAIPTAMKLWVGYEYSQRKVRV